MYAHNKLGERISQLSNLWLLARSKILFYVAEIKALQLAVLPKLFSILCEATLRKEERKITSANVTAVGFGET